MVNETACSFVGRNLSSHLPRSYLVTWLFATPKVRSRRLQCQGVVRKGPNDLNKLDTPVAALGLWIARLVQVFWRACLLDVQMQRARMLQALKQVQRDRATQPRIISWALAVGQSRSFFSVSLQGWKHRPTLLVRSYRPKVTLCAGSRRVSPTSNQSCIASALQT